ncbi:hypothetical protein SCHIN_v1c11450 [Spiroplasma chinense]|uniref:Lipoprotein n=1 Tax=Spiroplasma chinense TaxID=216932 RepID=A0A5B9Y594_9MOLU|nr:hypothetical protein [Spiroplasma chinense]QEH62338.1 hypothetical protein SCHIN_v1c11450 [Spiroplasma chinense]
MKKLLSMLAITGMVTSVGSTVVACNSTPSTGSGNGEEQQVDQSKALDLASLPKDWDFLEPGITITNLQKEVAKYLSQDVDNDINYTDGTYYIKVYENNSKDAMLSKDIIRAGQSYKIESFKANKYFKGSYQFEFEKVSLNEVYLGDTANEWAFVAATNFESAKDVIVSSLFKGAFTSDFKEISATNLDEKGNIQVGSEIKLVVDPNTSSYKDSEITIKMENKADAFYLFKQYASNLFTSNGADSFFNNLKWYSENQKRGPLVDIFTTETVKFDKLESNAFKPESEVTVNYAENNYFENQGNEKKTVKEIKELV